MKIFRTPTHPPVLRIAFLLLLSVAAIALSGCSSLTARAFSGQFTPGPSPCYFAGVRSDFVSTFCNGNSEDPWFAPFYSTLDAPFSLCADVCFFPYDIYTSCVPASDMENKEAVPRDEQHQ